MLFKPETASKAAAGASDMVPHKALPAKIAAECKHFRQFKQTRIFESLNGWRALAIIAVIWHHTAAPAFSSPIAFEGRHGVTLFFGISGFLIVTLILRSMESDRGFSLLVFWGRRALRILPIYYTVLALYIALIYGTADSSTRAAFMTHLPFFATFTTNWFVDNSEKTTFFFSWSLAAEEQFYLVWPLVEVFVVGRVYKFVLLGGLLIVSQGLLAYYGQIGDGPLVARMLYNIPMGILLGTCLAHGLDCKPIFRALYYALGRRGSALGCLILVGMVLWVAPFIGFSGKLALPIALVLLLAATVIREDSDLAPVLRWTPLAWIGTVSYGMYMMHMLVVNIVRRGVTVMHFASPGWVFVLTVALALALASISFVFYERWFLQFKDRLWASDAKGAYRPVWKSARP